MLLQAQISGSGRKEHPNVNSPVGSGEGKSSWYIPCKVVLEFLAAACLLVLTAPVVLLSALLIKLTSRGPAIYVQTRLGRYGRHYRIYKLRTMTHNCESKSGPRWATVNDPRITRLGRFLRATHLDELPQLWNVLKGDMSLVGPRPERPEFVPALERAMPHYRQRLLVRPGVTGLAQIQLPADTDLESVRRKLAYDLFYVRQVGFWLDLRIIAGTAFKMIGTPFPFLRKLFWMPSVEVIEDAYRNLPARRVVQAQPA
ncbi:MAG TPA: sugar transferase [Gemmataceae bacterium]|jgi:lipopolysaccharide/colanic/teichoic acid biosynthesis glycosyltransferase